MISPVLQGGGGVGLGEATARGVAGVGFFFWKGGGQWGLGGTEILGICLI